MDVVPVALAPARLRLTADGRRRGAVEQVADLPVEQAEAMVEEEEEEEEEEESVSVQAEAASDDRRAEASGSASAGAGSIRSILSTESGVTTKRQGRSG